MFARANFVVFIPGVKVEAGCRFFCACACLILVYICGHYE